MRNLRALFSLVRVGNFGVTTLQDYNGRHVRHNRVPVRVLLHFSGIVRLNKRCQPTTVERRRVPLVNLLKRRRRHLVRILRLNASTRRALNFLSITTALPRTRKHAFNLTLNLQLNHLSRKYGIAFRGLQLRCIGRATRILRRRSLATPLLHNHKGQRSTNLCHANRLLTNNKRRLTRRLGRALMYTRHLLFKVRQYLVPYNIILHGNMFTGLTHALRFHDPVLSLIHSKVHNLLIRARVHNQVNKRYHGLHRVLGHLMNKCTPLLARTIGVTRVANRAQARTGRLVNGLVGAKKDGPQLRTSNYGRLAIGHDINAVVNSVRRLSTRFIYNGNLCGAALLVNRAQRVRREPSIRRTAQHGHHNLLNNVINSHAVRGRQVTHKDGLQNMSSNVIHVTSLVLTVEVNVGQAMLQGFNAFRHFNNKLISHRDIRNNVTNQALHRLISSLPTFRRRLQYQVRGTSRGGIPFSLGVERHINHGTYSNDRRHKYFQHTAFMVQAIRRLKLIRCSIILTRRNNRDHVRTCTPYRHSRHAIFGVTSFFTRLSQVRRCQRLITFPSNRTGRRERFTRTTSATFHLAVIRRALRAAPNNARRTIITRRKVGLRVPTNRRLHSTKQVHVHRIGLNTRLHRILGQQQQ